MAEMDEFYPQYTVAEVDEILKDAGMNRKIFEQLHEMLYLENTDSYKITEVAIKYLYFIGSSLGVIFNLLIVFVLLNMKGSLKVALQLLLNQALADLCQSSLRIVWYFFRFDTTMKFISGREPDVSTVGFVFRRLCSDVFFLCELIAHITVVMLAVDILIAVRMPLKYRSLMSKSRGKFVIASIWSGCCVFVMFSTLTIEILKVLRKIENTWYNYMWFYAGVREVFNAVFLAMVALNIAIVVEVKKRILMSFRVTRHRKMAFMFSMMIITYFVCNAPFLSTLLLTVNPQGFMGEMTLIYEVAHSLRAFRAVFNPLVYTFRTPEVRLQAKRLLRKVHW